MKKILPILTISLLLFGFYLNKANAEGYAVSGHNIILDAGHGGDDPGTTQCPGLYEKTANLDIAFKLKKLLEDAGATVYMTREDDSTLSNEARYTYANTTDAEVLLSIHLNGSTDHSVNGTKGLYSKPKKDKAFTSAVHINMNEDLGVKDLGMTNFMSGVILKFLRPATIQESVYLSNTQECEKFKAGTRAGEVAQALFNGLNNWFE